jgi:hypothetical protein
MTQRINARILMAAVSLAACMPSLAADDPAQLKDLTSVVALLGVPCGQVISATRVKDNDNIVTCQDGNRYHVYVNDKGRVVADKL